jgi:3-oxoacyl-(acyl-carrier-protein) synthase
MQKTHRVAVTGLSGITPVGLTVNETFANCVAGKSGIRNMVDEFPEFKQFKCQLGATIPKEFNHKDYKIRLADSRIYGLTHACV